MSACPPVSAIVEAIEVGDFSSDLAAHLQDCQACQSIQATLRDESEGLTISVAALWVREKISCPHPDILMAYSASGLAAEEMDYIGFHLDTVQCPNCQSALTEIEERATNRDTPERLDRAFDDSMARSQAALRAMKP